MVTEEERRLRGRLQWARRRDRENARKRAEYFLRNQAEIVRRQRRREIESEFAARPRVRFSAKSESEKQRLIAEVKKGPCLDCGGRFHPDAMDFDHRVPSEKSFSISKAKDAKFELLKRELAKCDLVCANCHRVRTARRRAGLPATLPPPEWHI